MDRPWAVRLAAGAFAVVTTLGCTPDDPAPDPATPEADTPTPEPATPEPELEETEPAARAPLTGRPVDDAETLERPLVAVKIDDADDALPQQGLEVSDIVYTELVEGGTTRLLALFHSEDPGEVGPVRSARESDAELLPAFDGLFAISGAAPQVIEQLRQADVSPLEEGRPAQAWRREPDRRAPHNLFVRADRLWEFIAALDEDDALDPADPRFAAARPWPIAENGEPMPRGEPAAGVRLAYSQAAHVGWRWNADAEVWQRSRDGQAHVDAEGAPLDADNVLVARVATSVGPRTDAAGAATVEIELLGSGRALVLRGGEAVEGRWERDTPTEPFRFVTEDGRPIELAVGRSWVELVPVSGSVEVESPAPPG